MTVHLDRGEAEFWQQYESVNEYVIATAHAAAQYVGRPKTSSLTLTRGRPTCLLPH